MKRYILACLLTSFILLSTGFIKLTPAFAYAALPQIALSVSKASPGATIEVMGGRFPEDSVVQFVMQNSGYQLSIGTVTADDHGEFSVAIWLPLDMQYGEYEFQAIDEKNQMAKAPIAIIADPSGQETGGQRDDSDALLAPMPASAANLPTPGLAPASSSQSQPPESSSIPLMWIAAGIGLILFLGLMVAGKRKR
jgi:hypothetical protein